MKLVSDIDNTVIGRENINYLDFDVKCLISYVSSRELSAFLSKGSNLVSLLCAVLNFLSNLSVCLFQFFPPCS